ncbi:MAG: CoA pyrophosphatase [Rhodopseudomonas palustris]|uniref:NUDIX hydrolase n=1 Tax=Rhodopseudomonas faecalis TaxID=99655 RepID=UPI000DA174A8|nr:CoA pyrophosphatase [Rhodopseudomonas faecalis]TAH65362.1 MAG: CoA pyrophosphatase [Rhodopseudomonas palustris]
MERAHNEALRQRIAARCAAFQRLEEAGHPPGLKHAAVAIAVLERTATEPSSFLLTRRAAGLRAHSLQWALPGGRCDPGEDAIGAALRELHEELGLALDAADVLGVLDDYPTRSGYLITPVVAWAGRDPALALNPHEVSSVHRIELAAIEAEDAFDFVRIPESERRVVRLRLDDDFIHAPTAALIYQFREVLAGRATRVADLEQPVFAWK